MLFAELHGKLDQTSTELERREDILTSTVFGTLLVADAIALLASWLNCSRRLGSDGRLTNDLLGLAAAEPMTYWFWPSVAGGTQPDVVLRIGRRLLVIEAKFSSNKSSATQDGDNASDADDIAVPDQLFREWRALRPTTPERAWYSDKLREAVERCELDLIYLVSARQAASALRELRESQHAIHAPLNEESRLWLLTWQDLHRLLVRQRDSTSPPWISELARLLDRRRNLAAFPGFHEVMQPVGHHEALEDWAGTWRHEKFGNPFSVFEHLDLDDFARNVATISTWADNRRGRQRCGYFNGLDALDTLTLERLAEHLEQQQIRQLLEGTDE